MTQITLGDLNIAVELKEIKNLHLSVLPPDGKVRISAPKKMDLDKIRVYALSKLQWIRNQQKKFKSQARETTREYLTRESHYYQGKRYLLKIIEVDEKPKVILKHSEIHLCIKPNSDVHKRKEILESWYRMQLKEQIPNIIDRWEKKIGVYSNSFGIKKMKTKWGSCNTESKKIWINLELAKKPVECLEYIVLHELIHLIERTHNEKFIKLLDTHMPKWRFHKEELNRFPISHPSWEY